LEVLKLLFGQGNLEQICIGVEALEKVRHPERHRMENFLKRKPPSSFAGVGRREI
jgi:hypothetical protein